MKARKNASANKRWLLAKHSGSLRTPEHRRLAQEGCLGVTRNLDWHISQALKLLNTRLHKNEHLPVTLALKLMWSNLWDTNQLHSSKIASQKSKDGLTPFTSSGCWCSTLRQTLHYAGSLLSSKAYKLQWIQTVTEPSFSMPRWSHL